jgi:predicted Fe-Mo cluster-binding NifX family protein/ferredoxin
VVVDARPNASHLAAVLDAVEVHTEAVTKGEVARVDPMRCIACGECVAACEHQAFLVPPSGPPLPRVDAVRCVGCRDCLPACPVDAIDMTPDQIGELDYRTCRWGPVLLGRPRSASQPEPLLLERLLERAVALAAQSHKDTLLVALGSPPPAGCVALPHPAAARDATRIAAVSSLDEIQNLSATLDGARARGAWIAVTESNELAASLRDAGVATVAAGDEAEAAAAGISDDIAELLRRALRAAPPAAPTTPAGERGESGQAYPTESPSPEEAPPSASDPRHDAMSEKATTTTIAIPVHGDSISDHFGRCRHFAFVEVDREKRAILDETVATKPEQRQGSSPHFITEQGADVVLAMHMGPGAVSNLESADIEVVTGVPSMPWRNAVAQWLAGDLEATQAVCKHGHGHGPGLGHGHGRGACHGVGHRRGQGQARGQGRGRGPAQTGRRRTGDHHEA